MLRPVSVRIDEIYVPSRLRKTLDAARAETIAESIIDNGQETPIQVRQGKGRYVLVTGLHRLEALKLLDAETIDALVVSAQQH